MASSFAGGVMAGYLFLPITILAAQSISNPPIVEPSPTDRGEQPEEPVISPYWGSDLNQWSAQIASLSRTYGFHPDFIAAVIEHEFDGNAAKVDPADPVRGIGIVPAGLPVGSQSSPPVLVDVEMALRWGMAILSYVVQQSGGDLYTALAAYHGGWDRLKQSPPSDYASEVLDSYARAIAARYGISTDIAGEWRVLIQLENGNIPGESTLVLGPEPASGLQAVAEHTVYAFVDKQGHSLYIRGYIAPVSRPAIGTDPSYRLMTDQLEPALLSRLGENRAKKATGNQRILLACLPSLERLRGQTTTRWYSPSSCPLAERSD